VPHPLLDRPTRVPPTRVPMHPRPPARRGGAALLLSAVVLGGLVVVGADRALDAVTGFSAPFEEQVVDRSRPALMLSLADLEDYHAATGTFQVVVDLERDVRYVPAFVKGERTTYLAVGSVDGVVDFSGLSAEAVQTDGKSVTITLPAPQLDEPRIDLGQSEVLDRDRGVVDRVGGAFSDDPTSEREVALLGEDKLAAAAAESDLLQRARTNTRAMLTGLAESFGYDEVTVRFERGPGV
jgi:hypothetical protein